MGDARLRTSDSFVFSYVFIEALHNRERKHSSLGYVRPAHYEQACIAHSARVE